MRILAAILIAGFLAIPGVVAAKPFGYMGPGRAVGSHIDHAERKSRARATFNQTVTKPVPIAKAANPSRPSAPQPSAPKSTVGFHVTP